MYSNFLPRLQNKFPAEKAPVKEFKRNLPPSITGSLKVHKRIGQSNLRSTSAANVESTKFVFCKIIKSGLLILFKKSESMSKEVNSSSGITTSGKISANISRDFCRLSAALSI